MLPLQRAWVWSLVRVLRPHMPRGTVKKTKQNKTKVSLNHPFFWYPSFKNPFLTLFLPCLSFYRTLHELILYICLCPILLILFLIDLNPLSFCPHSPTNCSYQSSPQASRLLYPEVTAQFSFPWPKAVFGPVNHSPLETHSSLPEHHIAGFCPLSLLLVLPHLCDLWICSFIYFHFHGGHFIF